MIITKELKDAMVSLRLSGIIPTLPERISYANSKKLTFVELLEMIFYDELERRGARLLNTKMKKAGVDANLGAYDWDTTTIYDRELVKNLFSLSFIEAHASVLIFGPTGVGKTYLAKHLAFAALKAGYSVTFARADKLFKHLRCKFRFKIQQFFRSKIQPNHIVVSPVLSMFSFSSSCISAVLS
jgi:DNA replication protein DnaC